MPALLRAARNAGRATDRRRRAARDGSGRAAMTAEAPRHEGQRAAAISKTVVRALARTTGRGPTKAKTTIGDNGVFVVLQDSLTVGEQTLTDAGQGEAVLDLRRRWQGVMEADVSREIEELTGRKVVGFMSDNHIDPDLAVEVFVLEPLPNAPGRPALDGAIQRLDAAQAEATRLSPLGAPAAGTRAEPIGRRKAPTKPGLGSAKNNGEQPCLTTRHVERRDRVGAA